MSRARGAGCSRPRGNRRERTRRPLEIPRDLQQRLHQPRARHVRARLAMFVHL